MKPQIVKTQIRKTTDSTQWNKVADFLISEYQNIIYQYPKKETTIKTYIKDAKDFIQFVVNNGLNFNILRQFRKHLEQRTDIGAKTKNKKLTVARSLLFELYNHYQLIERDISKGAQNFDIAKGHVKDGLNAKEIEQVRVYIKGMTDSKKRSRIYAMFCLLAYQGLRQFELCDLKVNDLNLYDCTALINQKGSDSKKLINLHPETCKALTEYQNEYNRKDGYLFFSISNINKTDNSKKLTTAAIRYIWNTKRYGILHRAGVHGRSVHGFRHFFVTRMLEVTNGDILAVMKFSRHKSFESVKAYDDRKSEKELLPAYYSAF